jgi:hypothetical protein
MRYAYSTCKIISNERECAKCTSPPSQCIHVATMVEVKSCLTQCQSYWLRILKCKRGSREYLTGRFVTIGSATRIETNLTILCPKMH